MLRKVCVYCASSRRCDPVFFEAAEQLGKNLALNGVHIVYGGGTYGLMGKLADSAIEHGGKITGVLPRFMYDKELGHKQVDDMIVVDTMHERTRIMLDESDAFISLAGGCGTLHELFEALTWKRLGLHGKPIIIVNTKNYYAPLIDLLHKSIEEKFMDKEHKKMWNVVDSADDLMGLLANPPLWMDNALDFAIV